MVRLGFGLRLGKPAPLVSVNRVPHPFQAPRRRQAGRVRRAKAIATCGVDPDQPGRPPGRRSASTRPLPSDVESGRRRGQPSARAPVRERQLGGGAGRVELVVACMGKRRWVRYARWVPGYGWAYASEWASTFSQDDVPYVSSQRVLPLAATSEHVWPARWPRDSPGASVVPLGAVGLASGPGSRGGDVLEPARNGRTDQR